MEEMSMVNEWMGRRYFIRGPKFGVGEVVWYRHNLYFIVERCNVFLKSTSWRYVLRGCSTGRPNECWEWQLRRYRKSHTVNYLEWLECDASRRWLDSHPWWLTELNKLIDTGKMDMGGRDYIKAIALAASCPQKVSKESGDKILSYIGKIHGDIVKGIERAMPKMELNDAVNAPVCQVPEEYGIHDYRGEKIWSVPCDGGPLDLESPWSTFPATKEGEGWKGGVL
jgi:hypothetical protein